MAQSSVTIDAINNIKSGDLDLNPILHVSDIRSQTLILSDSVQHTEAVFDQRLTYSSRSVCKGSLICLTEYRLVPYASKELIMILDFHIIADEAPPHIISISALSPSQGRWAIKATVTAKGDDGKHFYFDLIDSDGGAIRVTCSDSVTHFLCDFIEVGKVYMISKAGLKRAEKNFNHLNNEWEIFLESCASIDLCPIPPPTLSFVPISKIMKNNAIVDVIGVVAKVDSPVPSQRNAGRPCHKRYIKLIDGPSGSSIELTLWGEEFCNREGKILKSMLDSGLSPVLAVKSARVNKGSCGKSVGVETRWATELFINPNFPEAENLRAWFHKGDGRDLPFQVEEQDRERLMMLEEKELEIRRKAEKAQLQAEAKAAEEALMAKRKWEIDSEALRLDLQKVDLKQILEVMKDFYEKIKVYDRDKEERLKTLEELKAITEGYLSIINGRIEECGSVVSGLSTKSSDMNITVFTTEDPADLHRPLNVLKGILCSHSQVTNRKLSFPSRRPAFLSFDLNCIKYRVSVNGKHEVLFSRILTEIKTAHHCLKQVVLMAKAWAKRQGIYKRKSWGLSAFALYALVIFFLQCEGLFPPLKQLVPDSTLSKLKSECDYMSGQQDLLEHVSHWKNQNNRLHLQEYEGELLFLRFLEAFQGLAKDAEEKFISTREGLWMQKTENMVRDNLWVEDPFDVNKNLTDSTNMIAAAKITHKFESSMKIVRTGNYTTLRSMLGWDTNRYVG